MVNCSLVYNYNLTVSYLDGDCTFQGFTKHYIKGCMYSLGSPSWGNSMDIVTAFGEFYTSNLTLNTEYNDTYFYHLGINTYGNCHQYSANVFRFSRNISLLNDDIITISSPMISGDLKYGQIYPVKYLCDSICNVTYSIIKNDYIYEVLTINYNDRSSIMWKVLCSNNSNVRSFQEDIIFSFRGCNITQNFLVNYKYNNSSDY